MSKKTDWEIARGLADWVMTLGLEEEEFHRWSKGKEAEYGAGGSVVSVYIDEDFVSLDIKEDGEIKNTLSIHGTNMGEYYRVGEEHQNYEDLIEAIKADAKDFNIRYWNKVYRNKLRFLVKDSKNREVLAKKNKVEKLKEQIKELES